jgi:hypothetical protein
MELYMSYTAISLNDFFNSRAAHHMNREAITTNLTVPKLERLFQVAGEFFNRRDMGTWRGFCIDVTDKGLIFFACQEEKAHTEGATIWIEKNSAIDTEQIMSTIKTLARSELYVEFSNPKTGQKYNI